MKKNKSLIAYCGLYCGACSFKVAYDENNREHILHMPARYDQYKNTPLQFCPGCKLDNQCGTCAIRDCATNKQLSHCGLCEDFPCEKITKFNNDDVPHHLESIPNLKLLRDKGEDHWLRFQEQKWTCECGAKVSWYIEKCLKCGKPVKNCH